MLTDVLHLSPVVMFTMSGPGAVCSVLTQAAHVAPEPGRLEGHRFGQNRSLSQP